MDGFGAPELIQSGTDRIWKEWAKCNPACLGSPIDTFASAVDDLRSWMANRCDGWPDFTWTVATLDQFGLVQDYWDAAPASEFLYMHIDGQTDVLRHGGIHPGVDMRFGFHGSSPYSLRSILLQGSLNIGPAKLEVNGEILQGVFYHEGKRAHLCRSTYMHYVALAGTAWFYAPLFVLEAATHSYLKDGTARKTKVARTKSTHQNLTYPGEHQVLGVIWHIMHAVHVLQDPKATWSNLEPFWAGHYEVDCKPGEWEQLLRRSMMKALGDRPRRRDA